MFRFLRHSNQLPWLDFRDSLPFVLYSQAVTIDAQVDINTEVGVVHDIRLGELRLYTDFGRCCRPLFIVEDQRLKLRKRDIIRLIKGQSALPEEAEAEPYAWRDLIYGGLVECASTPFPNSEASLLHKHVYRLLSEQEKMLLCGDSYQLRGGLAIQHPSS